MVACDWFADAAPRAWAPREPVSLAMAADAAACWVAASDIPGVIRYAAGAMSVFRLPARVSSLACAGQACWALLDLSQPGEDRSHPPLCRLGEEGVRYFRPLFILDSLTSAGGEIFAVGARAADRGGAGPAFVLRLCGEGQLEVVAELPESISRGAVLWPGGSGPWVEIGGMGFVPGAGHWAAPVRMTGGSWQLGDHLPIPAAARLLVDAADSAWVWAAAPGERDGRHSYLVERVGESPSRGRTVLQVGSIPVAAGGGAVWASTGNWGTAPRRTLLRLDPGPGERIRLAEVTSWPDVAPLITSPVAPEGIDPAAWARERCAELAAELSGGPAGSGTGATLPCIPGVTFESVTLAGTYPGTECVVRFRLDSRPGAAFGRRVRCFDELGAPRWGWPGLRLREDIGTDAAPLAEHEPGPDGVAWI
jgi:hypothetical protein